MELKKEYLKIVGMTVIVWVCSVRGQVTVLWDLLDKLVSKMLIAIETYNVCITQLMVHNRPVSLLLLLMVIVIKILGNNVNLVHNVFWLLVNSTPDASICTVYLDKLHFHSLELILLLLVMLITLKCAHLDITKIIH